MSTKEPISKLSISKSHRGSSITGYTVLLSGIRKNLLEGQARIAAARVRTYWETGRLVNAHISQYSGGDSSYGDKVIRRLSKDLSVSTTVLYRCVKFQNAYPDLQKVAGRPLFKWSHYRELITIPDDRKRRFWEKTAFNNSWTSDELALRIREKKSDRESRDTAGTAQSPGSTAPLTPLRGQLYTCRLVQRPNISPEDSGLLVDLGFGIYHEVDADLLSGFQKDQIVEGRFDKKGWRFYKSDRTGKDLFTYTAYVEKVVDGDTVKVRLDLGFQVWTRQILRLRGLDCPEVGTPRGDEARTFVRSLLKEAQRIVVRSSRSDKYDRYLADVFIPSPMDGEADVYLNNLLLETRRAVRM